MKLLFENFLKIIKQARGQGNMFGYKTTTANQLYLLFCIIGKIHTTEKVDNTFKYIWLIWHYGPIIGMVSVIAFIFDGIEIDFQLLLYMFYLTVICSNTIIIIPLSTYWFGENIERLIEHVDSKLNWRPVSHQKHKDTLDLENVAFSLALTLIPFGFLYNMSGILDVILFYEHEKVTDYRYYLIPLPRLENYATKEFFIGFNMVVFLSTILTFVEGVCLVVLISWWGALCYNEMIIIRDHLRHQTDLLVSYMENGKKADQVLYSYETKCEQASAIFIPELIKCVNGLQEITRMTEYLRTFYELTNSVFLPSALVCLTTHGYGILSEASSVAVSCKEMGMFVFLTLFLFWSCKTGEMLNDMADVMSFEVYSTPWYYTTVEIRKYILFFMCQTQRKTNVTALMVYPLTTNTFMRLINIVYSAINFLRKVT